MTSLSSDYKEFYNKILANIPKKRVFTDSLHTLAYGTEASFYRITPKVVVFTETTDEVKQVLKEASALGLPVCFRAAGTSLSGQSITDSILIVTSRDWNRISTNEDKSLVTMDPSVLGASVNNFLKGSGKKMGPDPASIDRVMMSGIVANNASGMCCGVHENSFETMADVKIILADGTELDTANKKSREAFKRTHPELLNGLADIRKRILENKDLHAKILRKYSIKNVTGYAINSFLKSDDPVDIIKYLMVGSEGTLAFMKEITLKTVVDHQDKASALMLFNNLKEACEAVAIMKLECAKEVAAGELMDKIALKAISTKDGIPDYVKNLTGDETALLVETRAANKEDLQKNIKTIVDKIKSIKTAVPIAFTDKVEEYSKFWTVRKGVFPASVGSREPGTTGVIEDIACPIEFLPEMAVRLQNIIAKYGYEDGVIYGHALEGNFHFILNQRFDSDEQIERYDALMMEVIEMIAGDYEGSLKAEHGTGRNMAAFIEYEWGTEAYQIMREIKSLFDPKALLNPDVIITDDKQLHLKNFKTMPVTNPYIDMCIECGFCESTCPSNVLTLTPRQRTVCNRHMTKLKTEGKLKELEEFTKMYQYDGIETCATCQICSLSCPVDIDTGKYTKILRSQQKSDTWRKVSTKITNNYGSLLSVGGVVLSTVKVINKVIPDAVMSGISGAVTNLAGGAIPKWTASLPGGNSFTGTPTLKSENKIVYYSTCINRTLANPKQGDEKPISEVMIAVLERAGYEVIIPGHLHGLCCGMPFSSKGFFEDGKTKSQELERSLLEATQNGKYPVICDMTSCTKTMIQNFESDMKIYDTVDFTHDVLLDKLTFKQVDDPIVIHINCCTSILGQAEKFKAIAEICSSDVTVPPSSNCCGFAGDRGFNFPELNKSALRHLKAEIPSRVKYAFSTAKACEIGLTEESGLDYKGFIYMVDRCTQ